MIKSEKKLKNLATLLQQNNTALMVQAIEMLRDDEPFEGAIALLAACYDNDNEPMVQKAIEEFMNDLNDKELRPEVMNEIRKDRKPQTLRMLVSSCWQSGMDYSEYLSEMAELFINSDYEVALECFSVIGESVHLLGRNEKDRIEGMLKNSITEGNETKNALTGELLLVLSE